MKTIITSRPDTDWAELPTGEYPSRRAALAAIAASENCARDAMGNDPGLYLVPGGQRHDGFYAAVNGRRVDVSRWPSVKLT